MKKYALLLLSALFLFAMTTQAEGKKGKGPTIQERVAKMTTDLGLSAAEQASVTTLFEKQDAEKKQFNKDNEKGAEDYKAKMKEMQKRQGDELKAIIGAEKYKKYQEIRKAEKENEKKNEPKGE